MEISLVNSDCKKETYRVSPLVLAVVVFIEVPHIPLLRVTVKLYSVFSVRPVISHGLDVHASQAVDDGVQLTVLVMSEGVSGLSHRKVITVQSLSTVVATMLLGGGRGSAELQRGIRLMHVLVLFILYFI